MRLDPVLLEVLRHKATAAAEEMALTLTRTARTVYVKEAADFCTAIAGTNGKFFAYPEATGVSGFIALDCGPAIAAVGELEEGDVILTNDPYTSGALASHLPDLQLLRPYFHDGKIVGYGWNFAHTSDIGGGVPSSISPRFSDIFQEGFQIPPIKLVKRGQMNQDVLRLYMANCRTPEVNVGDLQAMLAALETGARRVADMIAAHGIDTFLQAQTDLADYAAEKARAVLRKVPDGVYDFWDYMDDDFVSRIPIRIRARMTVKDGKIHVDFAGTDPQVMAAYNVPTADATHPWLSLRLMHLVTSNDKTAPLNHGLYRHFSTSAPRGTLLNPEYPAAVGVRHASVLRIGDVLTGAVQKAGHHLMPAAGGGSIIPFVLAEYDASTGNRGSTVMQALICGSGARQGADGTDGRECGMSNVQNAPIERTEDDCGVVVEDYSLWPDSGGPGRWRGGTGVRFTVRILREGSAVLGRGLERFVFRPWGVAGGMTGGQARVVLNYGQAGERDLGKLDMLEVRRGDTVTVMTPGGGGWGNPYERSLQAVQDDVRRGFVSVAAAARDYGVVFVEGAVDAAATERLRAEKLKIARPSFDYGPERERWETVFSDELVSALNEALLASPSAARARLRHDIYHEIAPGLADRSRPVIEAITDPADQRAKLVAAIERLKQNRLAA